MFNAVHKRIVPNTTNMQIALSIRQPWAWLIIRPDLISAADRLHAAHNGLFKDVENRTWPAKYTGPLLIHAGKSCTSQEYHDCQNFLGESDLPITLPAFENFQLGGIIGRVQMCGCHSYSDSKWFAGPFGFKLSDSEIIPFVPFRGSLGFFRV